MAGAFVGVMSDLVFALFLSAALGVMNPRLGFCLLFIFIVVVELFGEGFLT